MYRVEKYSILLVVYSDGRVWYKVKKGRTIRSMVNYFRGRSNFRYAKLFYYSPRSGVGSLYFWFNRETSGTSN